MKVGLIQGTKNATKLLADIASICYGHDEAKNPEQLVKNLDKLGHYSVFEHAFYTFKIEGISRDCLAQLTRHRHASYTVRSQRYCDESEVEFVIPNNVEEDTKMVIGSLLGNMQSAYKKLLKVGVKREDARAILPGATSTDLYMTLNLRELLHIFDLRVSEKAQEEIRILVRYMVDLVCQHDDKLIFLFEKEEL